MACNVRFVCDSAWIVSCGRVRAGIVSIVVGMVARVRPLTTQVSDEQLFCWKNAPFWENTVHEEAGFGSDVAFHQAS